MRSDDLVELRGGVADLRETILRDGALRLAAWRDWIACADFMPSAENFAHYLALRHNDIRPLQRKLMRFGLSSLGRVESKVIPELDQVIAILDGLIEGTEFTAAPEAVFFAGQERIAARSGRIFGPLTEHGPVSLMVTMPSFAADDPAFCERLAIEGVEAVRINCAHDGPEVWARMIAHVDRAAGTVGRRMKVLMDLAGPKIRTGTLRDAKGQKRVRFGDSLALCRPGSLVHVPSGQPAIECSLAEPLEALALGQRVFVDDGKLATRVISLEDWGVQLQAEAAPLEKGYKLKPEKGLNFPDCALNIPALTEVDQKALRFAAEHADGIEFSFVQELRDVELLQSYLAEIRPDDWHELSLILKIETERAVRNLPDMLVRAAGRQPTAVMIARGDLAVEIGFARLAEIQEEILWLCEAAQVPVIWATQVLESFLKTGVPTRGEMTDAAMGARAECVMLNKGPYLFEAIGQLDHLFGRMAAHMNKKTPQLRALKSW